MDLQVKETNINELLNDMKVAVKRKNQFEKQPEQDNKNRKKQADISLI